MKQRYPRIGLRFRARVGAGWSDVWTVTSIGDDGVWFFNPQRDNGDRRARCLSWTDWWRQLASRRIRLTR